MASAGVRLDIPRNRKVRLAWTPDLEARFNEAVEKLGGLEEATPAQIKEEMKTNLTLGHIKSHLQKIRKDNLVVLSRNSFSEPRVGDDTSNSASAGASDRIAAPVNARRSFDMAFPEPTAAPEGRLYSSLTRSRELSAQLEVEIASFAGFNC